MTNTALKYLWATQATAGNDAGSWDWLNFGLAPWEAGGSRAFGAVLAALAVGSAPGYREALDEEAVRGTRLLREYLRRRFAEESLFNRLWIVESSTIFEGLLTADDRREVVDQLVALQQEDGGWALAPFGGYKRVDRTVQAKDSDGYATGLALHVLLHAGLPATRPELGRGFALVPVPPAGGRFLAGPLGQQGARPGNLHRQADDRCRNRNRRPGAGQVRVKVRPRRVRPGSVGAGIDGFAAGCASQAPTRWCSRPNP